MRTLDERRRTYRIAMCWVLACLPLIAGVSPGVAGVEKPDDIVAQVNGAMITRRMIEIYRDEPAFCSPDISPPSLVAGPRPGTCRPARADLIKAVVDAALLAQEAVRRGLDRQPYVAAQLRYAERYVASTLFTPEVLSQMSRDSRVESAKPTMSDMVVGSIDGEPVTAYDFYAEEGRKIYELDDRLDALKINLWALPLEPQSSNVATLASKIASLQTARRLNLLDKPAIRDKLAAWRIGVLAHAMRSALNGEAIASGRLPGIADTEILAFDLATDNADHAMQLVAALRKGEKAESLGLPLLTCQHDSARNYCRSDGLIVFDVNEKTLREYPQLLATISALPPGSVSDPIPAEVESQSGAKTEDFTPGPRGIPDDGIADDDFTPRPILYAFNVAVVVDRLERRLATPASPASADAITAEQLSQLHAKATIKMTHASDTRSSRPDARRRHLRQLSPGSPGFRQSSRKVWRICSSRLGKARLLTSHPRSWTDWKLTTGVRL